MKSTFGEEIEDHKAEDCPDCDGDGFYKTGVGWDGPDTYEDENNCYCDCHGMTL